MARKPFAPKTDKLAEKSGIAEAESIERVLTVGGKPIPPEFAHAIPFAHTDQGIAEVANNGKLKATPGVSVTSDAWDKQVQRKAEAQIWDSFDPFQEAIERVRQPGMSYRFLAPRVMDRRGKRGFENVTEGGTDVKVANMILGHMPIEAAERRNAHYREIGNEQLRNAGEQYELDQTKLIRDSKVKGMAPLRVGDVINDNHDHPGMVTPVGVETARNTGA